VVSRRSFLAGLSIAYLGCCRRLNALIGGMGGPVTGSPASSSTSTRIGNVYYLAPNGIAFIKDDEAAFIINPGGAHNAGTVAPDDSFHKVTFVPEPLSRAHRVEFQWSRRGDGIVGRLESDWAAEMNFRLGENWPGFGSVFSAEADRVKGVATLAGGKKVAWSLKSSPALKSADPGQFTVPLGGAGKPTYLVAGFGDLPSFDGIDALLAEAEKNYESRRPKAQGPSGDILAAISNNMNNSRIYSSDNKMLAISVSRTFGANSANSCPYFCWDSFFSALLACLDDPAMGRQTVRAILSGQTAEGLVPNFLHWNNGEISKDRSQPPVGSMCIWKMHQYRPDTDFLREVYPQLATWHAWWMKARNARNDGLLQWGTATGKLQYAQDETGWDDTPHFQGVEGLKMVGATMNAYAVDLCSLWAMDAHYLALISEAIGKPEEAKAYRKEAAGMNGRINSKLWNEKLGIYCSRFWDKDNGTPGDFLTRITPANFYPLISGAPDAGRAQEVLAIMTDPARFWGEWILPTVSRQDPVFFEQTYWHGTIWGPVNYLVFQGVKRYAPPQVITAFAQKSVRIFMDSWLANGYCGENFLSTDGTVRGNHNYTWGALMCLVGLESIIDIGDDGIPRVGPGYNEPVELMNLPIGGKLHRVSLRLGKPEVTIM